MRRGNGGSTVVGAMTRRTNPVEREVLERRQDEGKALRCPFVHRVLCRVRFRATMLAISCTSAVG